MKRLVVVVSVILSCVGLISCANPYSQHNGLSAEADDTARSGAFDITHSNALIPLAQSGGQIGVLFRQEIVYQRDGVYSLAVGALARVSAEESVYYYAPSEGVFGEASNVYINGSELSLHVDGRTIPFGRIGDDTRELDAGIERVIMNSGFAESLYVRDGSGQFGAYDRTVAEPTIEIAEQDQRIAIVKL